MLILDGGIGAEMDKRITTKKKDCSWCGRYHHTHPDVLCDVYKDFLTSGAQILSANTYSILQYLSNASDEEIDDSVGKAIALVSSLGDSNVRIAACISAHGGANFPVEDVRKSLFLLASCIAKHPVDYVLVEMIQQEEIGTMMIEAATSIRKPTILGFSVVKNEEDQLVLKEEDKAFDEALVKRMIDGYDNILCVGLMHSNIDLMDESLCVIEKVWDGNLILYPDCGVFENNTWESSASDEHSLNIVKTLKRIKEIHPKLFIVGGCCGLGPSYIGQLSEEFKPCVEA